MNAFIFRYRISLSAAGSIILMSLLLSWSPRSSLPVTKPLIVTLKLHKDQTVSGPASVHKPAYPVAARKQPSAKVVHAVKPAPTDATRPAKLTESVTSAVMPADFSARQTFAVQASAHAKITPAPSAADSARNAEAAYANRVRDYLQTAKRYPSGREASLQRPAGTSVIWFILSRNGSLIDSGIETSANSILLDNAALSTIRRSNYPAFPVEVWPERAQHRFSVELNFIPIN